MAKKALITGVTGQDGSYLAELLLDEGYEVIGTPAKAEKVLGWKRDVDFPTLVQMMVESDIDAISRQLR